MRLILALPIDQMAFEMDILVLSFSVFQHITMCNCDLDM